MVRRRKKEGGNVFDDKIRVGVAVYFLVRRKELSGFKVFYNAVADYAKSYDKVEYVTGKTLSSFDFSEIEPDDAGRWLNQSNSDFASLLTLAESEAKFAKRVADQRAVFKLFANGAKSNRDEWVYDFDAQNLRDKAIFFAYVFNEFGDNGDGPYNTVIKWSSTLRDRWLRNDRIVYNETNLMASLYRPFVVKCHFTDVAVNDRLTRNHYEMFGPNLQRPNKVICFSGVASSKSFQALATDRLFGFDMLEKTQCLPLYRYDKKGKQVANITRWGLRQFREHYGDDSITAEDIFAYTYAVLHDPAYCEMYAVDLRREFPRLPFHDDFAAWAAMGRELLELHTGFESAEPYPLRREEMRRPARLSRTRAAEWPRAFLSAHKGRGAIALDEQTTLAGVPPEAWQYRLGSRSALEWVLDQYKEKKPRDPTIRERSTPTSSPTTRSGS